MTKVQKIVIYATYSVLSIAIPLILYFILDSKEVTVVMPIIILAVTFIIWNIYGGRIDKENFKKKKKVSKHSDEYLDGLKDIKRMLLILMGIELLIILFMGLAVYYWL
ncbi:MAG: hypothetical protein K6A63_05445 [Acholeplasmatales bacterium]|nr:hypothetical protein [Acholeplasmatales bacterium]